MNISTRVLIVQIRDRVFVKEPSVCCVSVTRNAAEKRIRGRLGKFSFGARTKGTMMKMKGILLLFFFVYFFSYPLKRIYKTMSWLGT